MVLFLCAVRPEQQIPGPRGWARGLRSQGRRCGAGADFRHRRAPGAAQEQRERRRAQGGLTYVSIQRKRRDRHRPQRAGHRRASLVERDGGPSCGRFEDQRRAVSAGRSQGFPIRQRRIELRGRRAKRERPAPEGKAQNGCGDHDDRRNQNHFYECKPLLAHTVVSAPPADTSASRAAARPASRRGAPRPCIAEPP